MRIATIDCGTNTILLLIAESDGQVLDVLVDREEIVGLGRGFDRAGGLQADAMARTLAQLADYVRVIAQHRCDVVAAVGTEALRKAKNGDDFVARANTLLQTVGGALEVIAGEREARLCWLATRASFPSLPLPFSVLDIGGGSTEFIVGDAAAQAMASIPIGSVRLRERFLTSDPPTAAQIAQTRAAIAEALRSAPTLRGTLIALAGTATTLAALALQNTGDVHGTRIVRAKIDEWVDRLGQLRLSDRRTLPGVHPERADYIFAGGLILQAVMAAGPFSEMIVSDRGVRWGLFYEHAT